MPLLLHEKIKEGGEIGIWEINENIDFFQNHMILYPEEEKEVKKLSDRKKIEWMASRFLLHIMSGRRIRGACLKDSYGKPFLSGSRFHISMSHSGNRAAVIASPFKSGIDIQKRVEKITRIKHKFCTDSELAHLPEGREIEFLHYIWGAKESIYKAYGRRALDFKENMGLKFHTIADNGGIAEGLMNKNNRVENYTVIAKATDAFYLVYAVLNNGEDEIDN